MRYQVSRIIVQRLCDERDDLVPYLNRIIDSLERHGGLYQSRLAEVVPADVVEELQEWLIGYLGAYRPAFARGLEAGMELLKRTFVETLIVAVGHYLVAT